MNILIIGSGGREHALSWKLARSTSVAAVYAAPGNAGTANEPKIKNIQIAADNFTALVKFAVDHDVSDATSSSSSLIDAPRSPSSSLAQSSHSSMASRLSSARVSSTILSNHI